MQLGRCLLKDVLCLQRHRDYCVGTQLGTCLYNRYALYATEPRHWNNSLVSFRVYGPKVTTLVIPKGKSVTFTLARVGQVLQVTEQLHEVAA